MHICLLHILLYLTHLSLFLTQSQQCIDNEYIGFYFNLSAPIVPTDPFGLSRFRNITFQVNIDCNEFLTANTTELALPIMYLSMTNGFPNLDLDIIEDWFYFGRTKTQALEDIIPRKETKSEVFSFVTDTWEEYVHNHTNDTATLFTAVPNWYNVWMLQAKTQQINDDCNSADRSTDTITSQLTFEWPTQYSQFFPVFKYNHSQTTFIDKDTQLPLEIVWNNQYPNNESIDVYYNMVVFKDESEWLHCFKTYYYDGTDNSQETDMAQTYYYHDIHDNVTYADDIIWDSQMAIDSYTPLIAYNNCNVSHQNEIVSPDSEEIKYECYENTCCKVQKSPHFFNIYFWYDDDVWTNSLALYQSLTQYTVEEALCDVYNEKYGDTLVPDDFYLSVTFFFNFCLLKNGGCPNYEQEKNEDKLTFFPANIDKNNNISGYKMYATFRTKPLEFSEKIHEMLALDKSNADKFQAYIVRRAQQDFGRHNFKLFGIAISDLPQRIIFKVPQYINYGVWGFVVFCTLFAIAGALHGFVYWGADCIRISGIVYFGLYTWDFYSDIVFGLELLNYPHLSYMFYASTSFIVIPWVANMVSLSRYQQRWCKDDAIRERVYSWFVSWQRLTYALAAISGSAFGTVELANSYVFGMDFFCMGLNERHLKRFNNNRLWSGIISENVPQLIIQFWFLSTLDWAPENSIVWLAIISSSLSVGAAVLDIYSAKKLFDVLEPNGVSIGKVSCSMHILSQEIRENAKKLQVSTYALRDALAETLTTHCRSVEMHFPITTADGLKIGFTVFSSKLEGRVIYERLLNNVWMTEEANVAKEPSELAKKIKKVWRLEGPMPVLPWKEVCVDELTWEEYEEFYHGLSAKHTTNVTGQTGLLNGESGGDIEMTNMKALKGNMEENNAIAMMGTFENRQQSTVALTGNSGGDMVSEYDAQMASLNAQIAMNQYLMMKQIEHMKESENESVGNELQQVMIAQMQEMSSMINMSKPYDSQQFQQFSAQWKEKQSAEREEEENGVVIDVNDNNYEPPELPNDEEEVLPQNNDNFGNQHSGGDNPW